MNSRATDSVRSHSNLSFLYQIRLAWWGLIELEALLPFFSFVNIKYKFDLLQRALVVSLSYFDFHDSKNYKNYRGGGGGSTLP